MGQIREITQFGRIEYEMLKAQGRFAMEAPERNLAHIRETAMRDFDAMVADPKSEISTKLGGLKNISRVRVYALEATPQAAFPLRLEFILIKPVGMLEDERKAAEKKAAAEAKKPKKVEGKKKETKGPFKRPDKPAELKKATFAKNKTKSRRPRQDDEMPFKPAELTGKTVPVERVVLPQRQYH